MAESQAHPMVGGSAAVSAYRSDDLLLIPVCDHCWRVNAARADSAAASEVLGFVEQRAEFAFEVMQLGRSFTWTMFPTLDEALSYLWRGSRAALAGKAAGELSWVS
ncbi:hypothetical protein [Subtercola endophyticus]|uniref:hypothetical protein n=1 Tax=Subtercola endophyticus TaxID=2895559 RepID=UPI001E6240DD|nr:hypothetical protein [Subtercola endophyticus]UFS59571.1 hypothetical protein LQ955_01860 [Subtercola endophyticus]